MLRVCCGSSLPSPGRARVCVCTCPPRLSFSVAEGTRRAPPCGGSGGGGGERYYCYSYSSLISSPSSSYDCLSCLLTVRHYTPAPPCPPPPSPPPVGACCMYASLPGISLFLSVCLRPCLPVAPAGPLHMYPWRRREPSTPPSPPKVSVSSSCCCCWVPVVSPPAAAAAPSLPFSSHPAPSLPLVQLLVHLLVLLLSVHRRPASLGAEHRGMCGGRR